MSCACDRWEECQKALRTKLHVDQLHTSRGAGNSLVCTAQNWFLSLAHVQHKHNGIGCGDRPGCKWFERITSDQTAATKKRFTIAERVGKIVSG